MKKITFWIVMVIVSISAVFLLFYICRNLETAFKEMDVDNGLGLVLSELFLYLFAFVIAFIDAIAGILGLVYLRDENIHIDINDLKWSKKDYLLSRMIKPIGYMFILFYIYSIYAGVMNDAPFDMILGVFGNILTIMHVIWFSAVIRSGYIRSEANIVNAYKRKS